MGTAVPGRNIARGLVQASGDNVSGHCANARSETALVPIGLVAMNDLLVHQGVDDRNGLAVAARSSFLVATFDGGRDLTNGTAHARTKGNIACAVLLSLFSGFFRGLGIGQRTLRKNDGTCPIQGAGSLLIDPTVVNLKPADLPIISTKCT